VKWQFKTIDEYLRIFPQETREILEEIRGIIHAAAPEAVETIGYNIPAFDLNGKHLVFFAGYAAHVSIYPVPSGDESLNRELSPYIKGKGTIQFPLNKPIPYELTEKIVKARIEEMKQHDA
jgi:uncharacterized protein YdhG (YjbR/CyaY superfamily)